MWALYLLRFPLSEIPVPHSNQRWWISIVFKHVPTVVEASVAAGAVERLLPAMGVNVPFPVVLGLKAFPHSWQAQSLGFFLGSRDKE